ncbi:hypothetical protein I2I05_08520 [Hymenobacter sp. BT683]|uniref:Uncharacterized protein n=1 Tax=Hymenobacter jeongseonensis TaxID=2791027 RepID=A0ABS0II10_9BACT|nr:hypothetical protein [Hymenobacter jeongseonensis]MBF9237440.1 hypothetical protein [Hymenobacter jeongseonensis]
MNLSIDIIITVLTFTGSLIAVYAKMQSSNAVIQSEISQLKKEVEDDKQDKKDFISALSAMQKTMHNLDKTITSMKAILKYKMNADTDDTTP